MQEESALSTLLVAPEHVSCDETVCREATSHPVTCRCSCGGAFHGLRVQVESAVGAIRFQSRADVRGGFTAAMVAAIDDEAF